MAWSIVAENQLHSGIHGSQLPHNDHDCHGTIANATSVPVSLENRKLGNFLNLPQSQKCKCIKYMHCQKPCRMDSEQRSVKYLHKPIMCHIDCPIPYHVTGACVRTNPPLFTWLVAYLTCVLRVVQSVPRIAQYPAGGVRSSSFSPQYPSNPWQRGVLYVQYI